MKREHLRIGLIVRSHGIKGEVKIQPLTDDADRYQNLKNVFIEQNGSFVQSKITVNRIDESGVYAYLEGCYTRDAADQLKDCYLCVERKDAVELPENVWFIADLEGLNVMGETQTLGTLVEVIQTGGVDVYRVKRTSGSHFLFPALKRVIRNVDLNAGVMELDEKALSEVSVDED